jgi:hypothetical protein
MGQSITNADGKQLMVAPDTVLSGRWAAGESFDYLEGFWTGGYGGGYGNRPVRGNKVLGTEHRRQYIFVKEAKLWVIVDTMTNENKAQNKYTQIWNFPHYNEEDRLATGFINEQVVLEPENRLVRTADPGGPNLWINNFSANELAYEKYYGSNEDNKYIGWIDEGGGGLSIPRPDVHVIWNSAEPVSQVATVLYPSKDMTQPYSSVTDISDKAENLTAFEMKTNDGANIYAYSSPDAAVFQRDGISVKAKTFVLYEKDGEYKGIVLDASELSLGGKNMSVEGSFEFTVSGSEFTKLEEIKVPTGFAWVDTAEGHYPIYDALSMEETQALANRVKGFSSVLRILKYDDVDYLIRKIEKSAAEIGEIYDNFDLIPGNDMKDAFKDAAEAFADKALSVIGFYGRAELTKRVENILDEMKRKEPGVTEIAISDAGQEE